MRDHTGRLIDTLGARNYGQLLGGGVPAPQGQVRVGKVNLPLRTLVVGNALIPVPWETKQEQDFLAWWTIFARYMGYSQNPDHDKHTHDWRGLWWLGFRGFDWTGRRHDIRYLPNIRRARRGQRPATTPTEEKVFGVLRTR